MERLIFSHKDIDRDELEVKEADEELIHHRGSLLFVVESDDLEPRSVALTPDKVDDLIGALERWRSGVITARAALTPPADLNPIYDAIVKRLTDEWLPRVLPLHQAPQAAVQVTAPTADFPVTSCHRSGNHDLDTMCSDCVCDPEPHDVGHAEEPAEHRPQDCPGAPACEEGEPADHGRLMSELQRAAVRPTTRLLRCDICGHYWTDHAGVACWGAVGCKCTVTRP